MNQSVYLKEFIICDKYNKQKRGRTFSDLDGNVCQQTVFSASSLFYNYLQFS